MVDNFCAALTGSISIPHKPRRHLPPKCSSQTRTATRPIRPQTPASRGTSHGKRLHRPWGFTQDLLPVLGSGLGQLQASPAPGSWALPHLSPADPPTVHYWLPPSPMCSLRTGKTRIQQVAPGGRSWVTQSRQAGVLQVMRPWDPPRGFGAEPRFSLHYICWRMVPPARSQAFSPHPGSKS